MSADHIQSDIGDVWAVVELQFSQSLHHTGPSEEASYSLVRHSLTMRQNQALKRGAVLREVDQRRVCDNDTFLQVQLLKVITTFSQSFESSIRQLTALSYF
jgi:hypothetical protein